MPCIMSRIAALPACLWALLLFCASCPGLAGASEAAPPILEETSPPGPQARTRQAPAETAGNPREVQGRIKGIRVDVAGEKEERVLFLLEGSSLPRTFVLEEGSLRVVCDFFGARLEPGIGRVIPVNGRIILRVRTWEHHEDQPRVRAVLDLAPDKAYEVDQLFFKEQNVYAVIVKEK